MKTLVLVPLTLLALTGCVTSGSGDARIDAMRPHLKPCAASMAENVPANTRRDCLPILVILNGAQ